jgi:hypothetical protein
LGVLCIDLSEGALIVESALHCAHGRVEHVGLDAKGVAGDTSSVTIWLAP